MKKLLSTFAAILLSGAIAAGAYLPNLTGPQDPSQLLSTLNALLQEVTAGVDGLIAAKPTTTSSIATTVEQNLASIVIPANTLTRSGQSLMLRCSGNFKNADSNTVKLYFGTSAVSSGAVIATGSAFDLSLLVTYNASATSTNYVGRGVVGATTVTPVATANSTDDLTTNLTAKCTTTQSQSTADDVRLVNFLVEQIK